MADVVLRGMDALDFGVNADFLVARRATDRAVFDAVRWYDGRQSVLPGEVLIAFPAVGLRRRVFSAGWPNCWTFSTAMPSNACTLALLEPPPPPPPPPPRPPVDLLGALRAQAALTASPLTLVWPPPVPLFGWVYGQASVAASLTLSYPPPVGITGNLIGQASLSLEAFALELGLPGGSVQGQAALEAMYAQHLDVGLPGGSVLGQGSSVLPELSVSLAVRQITPFAQGACVELDLEAASSGWLDWGLDTSYSGGAQAFSGGPGEVVIQLRGQQAATTYHARVRLASGRTSLDQTFTTLAASFVDWTVGFAFPGGYMGAAQTDRYGVMRMEFTRFLLPENLPYMIVYPRLDQHATAPGNYRLTPCVRVSASDYTGVALAWRTDEHRPSSVGGHWNWPEMPQTFATSPAGQPGINWTWDGGLGGPSGTSPPYLMLNRYTESGIPPDPASTTVFIKGVWVEAV